MDGPNLLNDFLVKHDITREQCAKHLKVSRTTLYYWLTEETSPGAASRDDICVWTRGEVPQGSWGPHADHRKKNDGPGVEPFPGGGHDQET